MRGRTQGEVLDPEPDNGDAEELSIRSSVSLNVLDRDLCDEQYFISIQPIYLQKPSDLVK